MIAIYFLAYFVKKVWVGKDEHDSGNGDLYSNASERLFQKK